MSNDLHVCMLERALKKKPDQVAQILEKWTLQELTSFVSQIDFDSAILLFQNIPPHLGADILLACSLENRVKYISAINPLLAAQILTFLSKEVSNEILNSVGDKSRSNIQLYLAYHAGVVGGWMQLDCAIAYSDYTVKEIHEALTVPQDLQLASTVFIIDRNRTLKGYIKPNTISKLDFDKELKTICNRANHVLGPQSSLQSVINHPGWLEHDYLPVLDSNNILLGVLSHQALRCGLDRQNALGLEKLEESSASYGLYGDTLISLLQG